MARLPTPGSDNNQWGDILNEYLLVAHTDSGSIRPEAVPVESVSGKTGAVTLARDDVGLGQVDNTSDDDKPVSTAAQAALDQRLVFVDVSTGSEPRPAGSARVLWIGGTTEPDNMENGDVWMQEV